VSIHANAAKNKRSKGIETYYLKNSNDRATLRLANLENGVDMLIRGDVSTDADLSYILSDIIQGQKEADSIRAASHIQEALVGGAKSRYADVDDLGVKQGPFLVLDGTYMAAVLVETGFVSNSTEAKRLMSSSYREALAEGMFEGIQRYFEDDRTALLR
jgi:N-acetylmuramoyl-L-alanine amidase